VRSLRLLLILAAAALVLPPLAAAAWGGPYTTSTGETVRITVSDAYAVDENESRGWAEFLASLPHGPELAEVSVYFATPRELRRLCGSQALACYSPGDELIVAPGEEIADAPSRRAILAHEYGHHLAENRANPPWRGIAYGTKRWASYVGVCAGVAAGDLGRSYGTDPGEVFAESYRVLVEQRLGLPLTPWLIVNADLQPDEAAVRLLEQDVLSPWVANTVTRLTGSTTRSYRVSTPLDGRMNVTLRAPRTAVFELSVTGAGTVRARGGATVSLTTTVCGTRDANMTVRRVKGKGAYRLTVSKP
jgi:hypothetical protein